MRHIEATGKQNIKLVDMSTKSLERENLRLREDNERLRRENERSPSDLLIPAPLIA